MSHPHLPKPGKRLPISTYRLQLNENFTCRDAIGVLDYLVALGVTDIYLSPILQAAPGSKHGYDVVDHRHVSRQIGGRKAFEELASAAHEAGLGVIVDVVPNHMAVPTPVWHSRAMWSVLKRGLESEYANWFDVEVNEPILMPILGARIGQVLAAGELELVKMRVPTEPDRGQQWVLRYFDHVFPVAEGTESLPLEVLVERQHYRLAHWKVASEELNYRRFFDVGSLAGIRVELPEVFNATHALLLELFNAGFIDAFRVDHPDGLADPRGYFRALSEATGGAWIVAEKILEANEQMPSDWPVSGTTGYDTAWRLNALNVNQSAALSLGAVMAQVSGDSPSSYRQIVREAKAQIIDTSLAAEVRRLGNVIWNICLEDFRLRDHTFRGLITCLRTLIIQMDRYRAYVVPSESAPALSRAVVQEAAARAKKELPEDLSDTMEVIVALVLGDEIGSAGNYESAAQKAEVLVRFQQVCGAVMAKGVEDTAFYRWTHLLSLTEVGSDPSQFGISVDEMHRHAAYIAAQWPATMTCGSTHDTKRGEDVRARLNTIASFPDKWSNLVADLREASNSYRPRDLDGRIEYILWQTLVGTWSDAGPISFDRLEGYLLKAAREQKTWTSWIDTAASREKRMTEFARNVLKDPAVRELVLCWREETAECTKAAILSTKTLQLTMPGVADIYQGTEMVGTSLVDPDNRRPVDFDARKKSLERLLSGWAPENIDEEKLDLVRRILALRAKLPNVFVSAESDYAALPVSTSHALAFSRGVGTPQVVVIAARTFANKDNWHSHTVGIPEGEWASIFHDQKVCGGVRPLSEVLGNSTVEILVRTELT